MPQRSQIVVLDDEPERVDEMKRCLGERLPDCQLVVFDNAPDMIAWLSRHLDEVHLLCLDHDLGPRRIRNGESFDPGIGQDVVNYLTKRTPICPVLIHTMNNLVAPGMTAVLDEAGWPHKRIVHYCDLEWISRSWIKCVAEILTKTGPRSINNYE